MQPALRQTRPFQVLFKHFFERFFDRESMAENYSSDTGIAQVLGLLAVPSAFFVLVFRPLTLSGWNLACIRFFFVSYSMTVMGIIVVLKWDALFPDRKDYQVLMPLPLRLRTLFLAKIASFATLLGVFLLDVNFFGFLFWPGIDARPEFLPVFLSHVVAVLAGGLFMALAAAAVQGVLFTLLSGTWLRSVSVALQTLLLAALIMNLVLIPLLGLMLPKLVMVDHTALSFLPGFWFTGLYEQLLSSSKHPVLLRLGDTALWALAAAAGLFLVTYLPGYTRHARKSIEEPTPSPKGPGWLSRHTAGLATRAFLRNPVERAMFHFIGATITRSAHHRIFLAVYGGFGAALAVMTLSPKQSSHLWEIDFGDAGMLRLPLTLSFVLVSGLRAAFNYPAQLRANWLFQLTETYGIGLYMHAARKWIMACAVVPMFMLLLPLEFTIYKWNDALFHTFFGLVLSAVLIEVMFAGFRKVPFTCSYFGGKGNLVGLAVIYVIGFTTYSHAMAALEVWLLRHPLAIPLWFGCCAASVIALRWFNRSELEEDRDLSYEDPGNPAVTTLGLAEG